MVRLGSFLFSRALYASALAMPLVPTYEEAPET